MFVFSIYHTLKRKRNSTTKQERLQEHDMILLISWGFDRRKDFDVIFGVFNKVNTHPWSPFLHLHAADSACRLKANIYTHIISIPPWRIIWSISWHAIVFIKFFLGGGNREDQYNIWLATQCNAMFTCCNLLVFFFFGCVWGLVCIVSSSFLDHREGIGCSK